MVIPLLSILLTLLSLTLYIYSTYHLLKETTVKNNSDQTTFENPLLRATQTRRQFRLFLLRSITPFSSLFSMISCVLSIWFNFGLFSIVMLLFTLFITLLYLLTYLALNLLLKDCLKKIAPLKEN